MKLAEDGYGRAIWIEEKGADGRPWIFYRYDSKGRLKRYSRTLWGWSVTPADIARFGDQTKL